MERGEGEAKREAAVVRPGIAKGESTGCGLAVGGVRWSLVSRRCGWHAESLWGGGAEWGGAAGSGGVGLGPGAPRGIDKRMASGQRLACGGPEGWAWMGIVWRRRGEGEEVGGKRPYPARR